jgi:O-acetylhomoserine (thiol)-lyase
MCSERVTRPRAETIVVHGAQSAGENAYAVAMPIYQTTAFVLKDIETAAAAFSLASDEDVYTRFENPTWATLEARLAMLEGGVAALVTASGQAAISYAVLNLLRQGDNLVSVTQLYGGAHNLFSHTLTAFGVEVRWVDADDPDAVAALVDDGTRLIYGETIGNPRLNVLDVPRWADAAHALGLPLVIDNTVPTPIGCHVLDHGADVAIHSLSKFIGGHGAALGGAIVDSGRFDWSGASSARFPQFNGPDPAFHGVEWSEVCGRAAYLGRARSVLLRNTGAALSPFNAFLLLQGLETLPMRMERHNANALAVAEHLATHDDVAWVSYPGLASSSYRGTADRLLERGYGGLVTFGVRGGMEAGKRFIESLRLVQHVANIGDARSLAVHSASTTHSQLNEVQLAAAGVTPETIRLSVGIEHIDDIVEDLDRALTSTRIRQN